MSFNQQKLEPIIGLEVHIELKTTSKMFCACSTEHFNVSPNSHTCPVCLGLPGALPFPNRKAVEWTILLGLALNCRINNFSKFDRKNYFYPDLPKGFQISQYDLPLAVNGNWQISPEKNVRIRRVHLEEDTGKLVHQGNATLIDYNRSSIPLVEIVTEPDFTSGEEVKLYLQRLQQLVRYLGIANADMEKGEMRCEPNVNLHITEDGQIYKTPIVEIKNVNSFRFVQQAIEYEIERQRSEFGEKRIEKKSGNKQTRGWNEDKKVTFPQREKEEAEDYRYFPEPDLPPMRFSDEEIEILKQQIPELPEAKKTRYINTFGLSEDTSDILVATNEKALYFEELVTLGQKEGLEPKELANLFVNKKIDSENLAPQDFIKEALIRKQVGTLPEEEIKKVISEVLSQNPSAVEDFKKGKMQALEFLVGQVARLTRGKADPNKVREILKAHLSSS